jgi:N-methylhydantoinase A/oxoprolinase/acetone carboxylase beta subunit
MVHGSTVATNAILERKGARVALLTTEGFEEVLQIGRQTRPELYNLFVKPRPALVDPHLVFGIAERLKATGEILIPLDRSALARVAKSVSQYGADIVAVCFLHSYANPAHERRAAEYLRRAGFQVCSSHEILPEYREFERWSTTVLNAYVTPLVSRYLTRLESQLNHISLLIMQSNGGSISAAGARAQAVRTVLSGPAGGVVGAQEVARAAGCHRLISFDMGGTSTDVSLIDRELGTTNESSVGGFPLRLPVLDIHTVGAGGGSIAWIDEGGALRVGPQSAGAEPGPACYGAGDQLTVTDANLLLGRLDPEQFFGGRMPLHNERASTSARLLARRLKLSVEELAEGVIQVANANMERALRFVSVQRGHDPREFALLAFGGAGGLHACELAELLGIRTVIVPRYAGVLSALGMLLADVSKDYSASLLRPSGNVTLSELRTGFRPLFERARRELKAEGFSARCQLLEPSLDVRYIGQSYELTVPFTSAFAQAFNELHSRRYGYSDPMRSAEIVNLRLKACGLTNKPALPRQRVTRNKPRPFAIRKGRFGRRLVGTAHFRWEDLRPGAQAGGPSVITGAEATVLVPPQFVFSVDQFMNVIIRRAGD